MSVLDSLQPSSVLTVTVCEQCLHVTFARIPDQELIRDLASNFKAKPGFDFHEGRTCFPGGRIDWTNLGLNYAASFPKNYIPLDVANAFQEICAAHGVKAEIIMSEGLRRNLSRFAFDSCEEAFPSISDNVLLEKVNYSPPTLKGVVGA